MTVVYRTCILCDCGLQDLYSGAVEFCLRELFVGCDEDVVAKPLSLVQSEYPTVQLGSYPNTSPTYVRQREGREERKPKTLYKLQNACTV